MQPRTSNVDPVDAPGFGNPTIWFNHTNGKLWRYDFTTESWQQQGSHAGGYADDTAAGTGSVGVGTVYLNTTTGLLHTRMS
jgi:hypothetical protein